MRYIIEETPREILNKPGTALAGTHFKVQKNNAQKDSLF